MNTINLYTGYAHEGKCVNFLANIRGHVVHEYILEAQFMPHMMQNMLTLLWKFVQICAYHPPGLMNTIHLQTASSSTVLAQLQGDKSVTPVSIYAT